MIQTATSFCGHAQKQLEETCALKDQECQHFRKQLKESQQKLKDKQELSSEELRVAKRAQASSEAAEQLIREQLEALKKRFDDETERLELQIQQDRDRFERALAEKEAQLEKREREAQKATKECLEA